jgi:hypothetical protein
VARVLIVTSMSCMVIAAGGLAGTTLP